MIVINVYNRRLGMIFGGMINFISIHFNQKAILRILLLWQFFYILILHRALNVSITKIYLIPANLLPRLYENYFVRYEELSLYIFPNLLDSIIDQIWRTSHPTVSINPFAKRGINNYIQPLSGSCCNRPIIFVLIIK